MREQGFHAEAEAYRDKFFARMWNLAAFMHDLKMRYTRWFNRAKEPAGSEKLRAERRPEPMEDSANGKYILRKGKTTHSGSRFWVLEHKPKKI